MELLCPAGNLASLKTALNAGADAVYLGLKDDTNARSFAGLNFTPKNYNKQPSTQSLGKRFSHYQYIP